MRVLLLGGTAEARTLAAQLLADGVDAITSLAGAVEGPRLPVGKVRIGGFGGIDGLVRYIRENEITSVIDATHPFATQMTANAVAACCGASRSPRCCCSCSARSARPTVRSSPSTR